MNNEIILHYIYLLKLILEAEKLKPDRDYQMITNALHHLSEIKYKFTGSYS